MAQAHFAQALTKLQSISAALFGGSDRHRADTPLFVDDETFVTRGNPAHPEHDKLGFRNPSVPRRPQLAVLGDSQVYGTHIAPQESWPSQTGNILDSTVYSCAVPGWGGLQYALAMDEVLRLRPKAVLVCPYLGNDIYEAFVHAKASGSKLASELMRGIDPHLTLPDGSIHYGMQDMLASTRQEHPDLDEHQLLGLCSERGEANVHHAALDKAEFYLTEHSRTPFEDLDQPAVQAGFTITARALAYARDAARSSAAAFAVMPIPTREYLVWKRREDATLQNPDALDRHGEVESRLLDALQSVCRDRNIRFFDPTAEMARLVGHGMYFQHSLDGHPTATGARAIANFVARRVMPELRNTGQSTLYPLY